MKFKTLLSCLDIFTVVSVVVDNGWEFDTYASNERLLNAFYNHYVVNIEPIENKLEVRLVSEVGGIS